MGFYSELQMELDDYEARRGMKASSQAVEFCKKKEHAERRMRDLAWKIKQLEPGSVLTKEHLLKHRSDIKEIFASAGLVKLCIGKGLLL